MTVEVVPLAPEHLDGFEPDPPVEIVVPADQFGEGLAARLDGRTLWVCCIWEVDGEALIRLAVSAEGRRYPVVLHRTARRVMRGLDAWGYTVRAEPGPVSPEWLHRLGFVPDDRGYVRCPGRHS